jgi:hypothetical protein
LAQDPVLEFGFEYDLIGPLKRKIMQVFLNQPFYSKQEKTLDLQSQVTAFVRKTILLLLELEKYVSKDYKHILSSAKTNS